MTPRTKAAAVQSLPAHRSVSGTSATRRLSTDADAVIEAVYGVVAPGDVNTHRVRLASTLPDTFRISGRTALANTRCAVPFVDLFCGAGGMSLGFELEGARCELAVDNDASAINTFKINRPPYAQAYCCDISNPDSVADVPSVPLVVGGPPCQGFSVANQQRQKVDARNRLYESFLAIAERTSATVLVMENVLGIRRHLPRISADLQTQGYHSDVFDIDAVDFGVPQNRRRLFIVAIRGMNFLSSEAFFNDIRCSLQMSAQRSVQVVLADALFGLPSLAAKTAKNSTDAESHEWGYSIAPFDGPSNTYLDQINLGFGAGPLFNHRSKYNNTRDVTLFSRMRPGDDSTADGVAALNPYRNRDHIFKDKFYRLRLDRPCKTITAHMYYDCNMYIHPLDHRGLTPREAARVQGFPDQYVFTGKPNEWYRQIGNAVSPVVARHLARAIIRAMTRRGITS